MATGRGTLAVVRSPIFQLPTRPKPQVGYSSNAICYRLSNSTRSSSQQSRMSSDTRKKEWMALVPDHPNAVEKRLSVRPEHLSNIKPLIQDKTIVFGGAILSDKGEMNGSFILVQADTEEEARDLIKRDVYVQNGVWNTDAMKIWPFRSAFRTPVD